MATPPTNVGGVMLIAMMVMILKKRGLMVLIPSGTWILVPQITLLES
jgi:hypothetical protein